MRSIEADVRASIPTPPAAMHHHRRRRHQTRTILACTSNSVLFDIAQNQAREWQTVQMEFNNKVQAIRQAQEVEMTAALEENGDEEQQITSLVTQHMTALETLTKSFTEEQQQLQERFTSMFWAAVDALAYDSEQQLPPPTIQPMLLLPFPTTTPSPINTNTAHYRDIAHFVSTALPPLKQIPPPSTNASLSTIWAGLTIMCSDTKQILLGSQFKMNFHIDLLVAPHPHNMWDPSNNTVPQFSTWSNFINILLTSHHLVCLGLPTINTFDAHKHSPEVMFTPLTTNTITPHSNLVGTHATCHGDNITTLCNLMDTSCCVDRMLLRVEDWTFDTFIKEIKEALYQVCFRRFAAPTNSLTRIGLLAPMSILRQSSVHQITWLRDCRLVLDDIFTTY